MTRRQALASLLVGLLIAVGSVKAAVDPVLYPASDARSQPWYSVAVVLFLAAIAVWI
jgi:hypothetical protein